MQGPKLFKTHISSNLAQHHRRLSEQRQRLRFAPRRLSVDLLNNLLQTLIMWMAAVFVLEKIIVLDGPVPFRSMCEAFLHRRFVDPCDLLMEESEQRTQAYSHQSQPSFCLRCATSACESHPFSTRGYASHGLVQGFASARDPHEAALRLRRRDCFERLCATR